ncbi:MAG: hypothetical protein RH948_09530 [Cyclobacteriaceae bacterium]
MKNKSIVTITLCLSLVLISLMVSSCSSGDSAPVSMGELDRLNLISLDSTQFEFTKGDLRGSLIAVVFSPGCDHCQAQAQEFHQNMDKLQDVTLLMIGSVPLQQIRDFSVKYELKELKNVRFAYSSPVTALSLWRIDNLPHIVLYDKDLKPVQTFTSTTSVDKILSHLK